MHPKTKELPQNGGYHRRVNKTDNPRTTDKPFCELLDSIIRKAYPNVRECEKESPVSAHTELVGD